jgi:lipopolysaccharide export system permease protein
MAGTAELKDAGNEGLSLELEKAFIHSAKEITWDNYDYAQADLLQYRVSNEDIMDNVVSVSPREMSSRDVYTTIITRRATVNERINTRKNRMIVQAVNLENTLRAGPESGLWSTKASNISGFNREFNSIRTIRADRTLTISLIELYRKFSAPFGAFCFVFIAVSLGLKKKKKGQTVGFMFGNIIAVIYWSMVFVGQTMGLRLGTSPFWSMWFSNIFFLVIGIIMAIRRVTK